MQNGDEASARRTLEQVQTIEPNNDLARKLMDQIKADPQKELGAVFFRYTVQRDDSLSKLAQQYMGDRFRFHILAKYNDIANPSRLAAGQVIKIRGARPPAAARRHRRAPHGDAAAGAASRGGRRGERRSREARRHRQRHAAQRRHGPDAAGPGAAEGGNLEGAYESFREAALRDPATAMRSCSATPPARRWRAATSARRRRRSSARSSTRRSASGTSVLALEPANQKAKLERERALDLQKR